MVIPDEAVHLADQRLPTVMVPEVLSIDGLTACLEPNHLVVSHLEIPRKTGQERPQRVTVL
jgi:hypothetical protein